MRPGIHYQIIMPFTYTKFTLLSIIIINFISIFPPTCISFDIDNSFIQCFSLGYKYSNSTTKVIHTQNSSSYTPLLQFSIRNHRFLNSSVPKPNLIITPTNLFQIQTTIICSKKQGLQIRVRSGGHDYEGLSYVSNVPFIIIDLTNLRTINIDMKEESAWIQSGATLGELYYAIANKSNVHGFPAGSCPTVGIGGHFSGGGFGTIFRKYGLAADNVIDAQIVDVNGNILNRKLMGENLFWAIRGGGGSSFGVITSWKIKLVHVPSMVTVFSIPKVLDQNVATLFMKWQVIANKLPNELFLHSVMELAPNASSDGGNTVLVSFTGLYLGKAENLVSLMQNNFAELNLKNNNCTEMSWIQSVLYFAGYSINGSLKVLLQRNQTYTSFFKAKSDYITEPIPMSGLEGLWNMLLEENNPTLIMSPYGGRMSEISESETPFPHRKGILYSIQYLVDWDSNEETPKHMDWMRKLYAYMTPYVSKFPRAAYLNYRDLDIGVNRENTSYEEAKSWGMKYFKSNFERLAQIKDEIDPSNFFRHEQSIPPLSY